MLKEMKRSLVIAGLRNNIDLTDVKLKTKLLDCTWGDKMGIEISNVHPEYLERVRNYVKNWLIKFESPKRKVNYQVSPSIHSENIVNWAYFPCND